MIWPAEPRHGERHLPCALGDQGYPQGRDPRFWRPELWEFPCDVRSSSSLQVRGRIAGLTGPAHDWLLFSLRCRADFAGSVLRQLRRARLRRVAGTSVLSARDLREATEEIPAVRSRPWDPPAVGVRADTQPSRSNGDRGSTLRPATPTAGARGLRRTIDDVGGPRRTGFASWRARQRDQSSRSAVVFCALLLVVAITIAWTLGSSGGGQPQASSAARTTPHTVPAHSESGPAPSPTRG